MTKELELWKSPFGDDYLKRNQLDPELLKARNGLWMQIFAQIQMFGSTKELPNSILEVGCGAGQNLIAINEIYKNNLMSLKTFANEPNEFTRVTTDANMRPYMFNPFWVAGDASSLDIGNYSVDMVFTSGVLIHIHPDNQIKALEEIYRTSKKYIICAEYFSPEIREVTYHGEKALWTRDYGAMWMDLFRVRCIGCIFCWKRITKIDNLTVWVFEKVN